MDMIDELRLEHSSILISFGNLANLDFSSQEDRQYLLSVKSTLLDHLRRENDSIYPKLLEAASNDAILKYTVDRYMGDLVRITTILILFLEKYSKHDTDASSFKREHNRLGTILHALFRIEEEVIFNEYLDITFGRVA